MKLAAGASFPGDLAAVKLAHVVPNFMGDRRQKAFREFDVGHQRPEHLLVPKHVAAADRPGDQIRDTGHEAQFYYATDGGLKQQEAGNAGRDQIVGINIASPKDPLPRNENLIEDCDGIPFVIAATQGTIIRESDRRRKAHGR